MQWISTVKVRHFSESFVILVNSSSREFSQSSHLDIAPVEMLHQNQDASPFCARLCFSLNFLLSVRVLVFCLWKGWVLCNWHEGLSVKAVSQKRRQISFAFWLLAQEECFNPARLVTVDVQLQFRRHSRLVSSVGEQFFAQNQRSGPCVAAQSKHWKSFSPLSLTQPPLVW